MANVRDCLFACVPVLIDGLCTSGGPPADRVRVWHDRSGTFRVDAAFLGYSNGKLRLHKTNGVIIEVPSEKMSIDDMKFVEHIMKKSSSGSSSRSPAEDDDVPLAVTKKRQPQPQSSTSTQSAMRNAPVKKTGPQIDWFEFFLNAGCDVDDCGRYAAAFERDKIDDTILADIGEGTMRSLGLREGDIIRVKKAIEARNPVPKDVKSHQAKEEQIRRDEELARQLQAEVNGRTTSPAPNLFAGPDGALKNQRRGRPQPSKSLPPPSVDPSALSNSSEQISRTSTPLVSSPTSTTPAAPQRSSSAAPASSGFDDDAWTPRPSSTKPVAPTPPAAAQVPPSAPVAPTPPPPPAGQTVLPTVAAPAPAPAAPQAAPPAVASPPANSSTGNGLAKTNDDIFDQLARLSQLRNQSPAVVSSSPVQAPSPMTSQPPPVSFQNGLGMGSSPVPLGQHLQNQQTGMLSPAPQNGPRGPYAPVPANQGLLQPLVPTSGSYTGFVPTRPSSQPPAFQNQQQPSFIQSQPTGFPMTQPIQSQPTGFPMNQSVLSQPTGYPNFGPVMSQPTGFGPGPFNSRGSLMSQPTGLPNGGFGSQSLQSGSGFGQVQSSE